MTRRLISNAEVLEEMLQDPEFRAEWERTALTRAVAEAVIRYRTEQAQGLHRPVSDGEAQAIFDGRPVTVHGGPSRCCVHVCNNLELGGLPRS